VAAGDQNEPRNFHSPTRIVLHSLTFHKGFIRSSDLSVEADNRGHAHFDSLPFRLFVYRKCYLYIGHHEVDLI